MVYSRDLNFLAPPFRDAVQEVLSKCLSRGFKMVPYCVIRTPFEQATLWRQSRSIEAISTKIAELEASGANYLANVIRLVGVQALRPRVTDALPGLSWHQWGEAVDCYYDESGHANWTNKEAYECYAEEAVKMGLTAGRYWKLRDAPHIQLRKGSPADSMSLSEISAKMKEMYEVHNVIGTGVI